MKAWLLLLSGLLIWAAHFFGVYVIGSVFPGTSASRWLVVLLTVVCLIAAVAVLALLFTRRRDAGENLDRWKISLGMSGSGLAIPAIVFQCLPAVIN